MNKHSLTLLEVIISALILSITTASILYLFSTGKIVVSHTGRKIQAMDFAGQTLEELRNAVREDTWDTGDLKIQETDWTSLSGDFGSKFSARRKYKVDQASTGAPTDTGYKRVRVTVDWTESSE